MKAGKNDLHAYNHSTLSSTRINPLPKTRKYKYNNVFHSTRMIKDEDKDCDNEKLIFRFHEPKAPIYPPSDNLLLSLKDPYCIIADFEDRQPMKSM